MASYALPSWGDYLGRLPNASRNAISADNPKDVYGIFSSVAGEGKGQKFRDYADSLYTTYFGDYGKVNLLDPTIAWEDYLGNYGSNPDDNWAFATNFDRRLPTPPDLRRMSWNYG